MIALLVAPALGAVATRDLYAALARDVLELQHLLEPAQAWRPGELERRNYIGEKSVEADSSQPRASDRAGCR